MENTHILSSAEIRSRFLSFFEEKGHSVIPSASLVPQNDPTVLFTTAGMHPLVPYLLGESHPLGARLASAQKCVRTEDIDEVGDNRHNTYFEMLGNWSLGDYFKNDSIRWSWEFLTDKDKGLGLEKERFFVTVFAGDETSPRDEESIGIWKDVFMSAGLTCEVDLPLEKGGRIFTMGRESNWWGPAGATGPCGPDTEIYYDLQDSQLALTNSQGMPDFDSGRLLEVWNNVFMQYNKNDKGEYSALEQKNVDTGMGLERMSTVCQRVSTVFETDLFTPLLSVLDNWMKESDQRTRYIVADHLKASVMLISDGVEPSNKLQGYVLRRLIRRAAFYSNTASDDFLRSVVEAVAAMYDAAYPEVGRNQDQIVAVLKSEVDKFFRTLEKGKDIIQKRDHIDGKVAFDLYQSYGFPFELTKDFAAKLGIAVDGEEFAIEMEKHQALSRTASQGQFKSGLADNGETTVKYHTATHLLHQALRNNLGEDAVQKGSNITPERLRFDFAYPHKLTTEQLAAIEKEVNDQIQGDLEVKREELPYPEAVAQGAVGLFGQKYPDIVSVYTVGGYSKEICTGPHVQRTGELGAFRIVKEEAVSAGIRRIKAVLA